MDGEKPAGNRSPAGVNELKIKSIGRRTGINF